MMRRIGIACVSHGWASMGVTARMLSTKQCYKPPKAAGGGLVIAPESMIEIVRAMDSGEARLLNGVPYCENVEAKRLLDEHCRDEPARVERRFSLVCNTGSMGVGKTMLQCQNMLQAAHKGYLSVFIDFNGKQPSPNQELRVDFETRVALRIAWYLCEKETKYGLHSRRELAKRGSEEMTIEDAVQKLKKYADHTGPVFLAVDELKKSAKNGPHEQRQEELEGNLTMLCEVMDWSIGKPRNDLSVNERIHLAVSVYDIVSLADLATESGRNLLHQPTPPVFPLWVARGSVDEAAISKLPLAMRIFFDRTARDALYAGVPRKKRDEVEQFISTLGALVFASAGHGRRVEVLVRELAKLPSSVSSLARHVSRALDLKVWKSDVDTVMDYVLNLDKIVPKLEEGAKKTSDPQQFLVHLLEGLFVRDDISDTDEGSRGMHMRLASLRHYGLLRAGQYTIGYLPTQVIVGVCSKYEKLPQSPCPEDLAKKHDALVGFVKSAANECTKIKEKVEGTNEQPKAFERAMMHTMCAALLSGRRLTDMMRFAQPLPENKEVGSLAHIDVKVEVGSFPCYLKNFKTWTTIDAALINEITAIGSVENRDRGLAFLPTHKYNLCCDFVLVLPLEGGGRVVLLVQCKHWFQDKLGVEGYAFDQFRWGQQFAKEEKVFQSKKKRTPGSIEIHNAAFPALDAIRNAKDGPTEIVHVLLTVNEAPREGRRMKNTLSSKPWNLPGHFRDAMLRDDEWLMDLEHMRGWCPSVAYSALMGLQVQNLWADADSSGKERRPRR